MKRLIAALAAIFLLGAGPVHAQAPERELAFVYGINAVAPGELVGTFAPPSAEAIHLIADQTSLISPRRTMIYFWPITNHYRAAWSELNELVEGALEVRQDGRLVTTVELSEYTIHFAADERGVATPVVHVGEAAVAAHERFEAEREAYREAVMLYERRRSEWLARPDRSPDEHPSVPEPLRIHSTGLNRGFPINLPPGGYEISVRGTDGATLEGSARRLVAMAPRRVAIGYSAIPEARWTMPEQITDPADAILGRRGSVVYLQPRMIYEYPALGYELLNNPQYPGDLPGAPWSWVTGELVDDAALEILVGGQAVDRLALTPYRVTQMPGSALGYEIAPLSPDPQHEGTRPADFVGYRLELGDELPAYSIRLMTPDGTVMEGSQREVRAIAPTDIRLLLLVIPLPILVGASVISVRQRRTARLRMAA